MNDEILTKLAEALMTLKCHGQFEFVMEGLKIDGSAKTATVEKMTVRTKFSQNEDDVPSSKEDEELIL